MNKITLKTDVLKTALKTYTGDVQLKATKTKSTDVVLAESTKDLLEFLNEHYPLTPAQRAKVSGFLFKGEKLGEAQVKSPDSFYNKLSFLSGETEPVLELKINNKWYPILTSVQKWRTLTGWIVGVAIHGNLGAMQYIKNFNVGDWDFEDNSGKIVLKSITEILAKNNVRIASKESLEHCKMLNKKLPEYRSYVGKMFDASGTGLAYHDFWGWSEANIGHKDSPVPIIIEPLLENRYAHHEMNGGGESWQLPFVRVFSLKHKEYMFVDIEDLQAHIFHPEDKEKIVLPKHMLTALDGVFNAKQDNIFGDLFHGRHGGIVVLANGPSGVGKTLTAEVFAEFQGRPLYTMEMSEVGTSLKEVEVNLQRIFARAKKWNAVLLFDEADIFLSERVSSDLERSAIVGIFLRLLDYYEGTFFLTTNRGSEIDKAFKGRVTLYLNYPALTDEIRKSIWKKMIAASGLTVKIRNVTWDQIASEDLNGRQIRNQVRLLRLMYPNNVLTTEDVLNSLDFAAR
jgi:hypothetical protein